jgi:hypothetical protein
MQSVNENMSKASAHAVASWRGIERALREESSKQKFEVSYS